MKLRNCLTVTAGIVVLLFAGCGEQPGKSTEMKEQITGAYLGQEIPGEKPELFAPGIISTGMSERDTAISPDGKQIYYSVQMGQVWAIVHVRETMDDVWTKPEVATFSGHYQDIEPFFAPDGGRLYFVSNRPISAGDEAKKDYDIWYVDRDGDGWSEPVNIGAPVNTDANEFYPAVTNDGTIYWTATYEGGSEDIHRSRLVDGTYSGRETLGEAINTQGYEFNAYVSPDESFLIFSSARRGDLGGGDLYISFRMGDGSWTPALNMGGEVNSTSLDYCPFVSPDGKYIFFSSRRTAVKPYPEGGVSYADLETMQLAPQNGQGDIYWISSAMLQRLRPANE